MQKRAILLIGTSAAVALALAGFPQGNLHDRYYNGLYFAPYGEGYIKKDYYGTTPRSEWIYAPTSDEIVTYLTGSLVIAYDGKEWVALGESSTGALIEGTAESLADALAVLYSRQ